MDHLAHAVSMVASIGAVMLLPAYAKSFLPSSVTSRPLHENAPTIDLVLGYNKVNKSSVLELFLSRLDEIAATPVALALRLVGASRLPGPPARRGRRPGALPEKPP